MNEDGYEGGPMMIGPVVRRHRAVCPNCDRSGTIRPEQYRGEAPIDCPTCPYHETHDHRNPESGE